MVVQFDKFERFEIPNLILCNPGCVYKNGSLTNAVGVLTDHEAEEIVFNFNAISELNFRINKVDRDDAEYDEYAKSLFDKIQNRRLIFVENIGFFSITSVVNGFSEGVRYKDVTAQSIETEIQQKMVPYIENGTYKFLTDAATGDKGILNTITELFPLWSLGEIDSDVAAKYRTFEDVDTSLNCLSFLIDNVQDAYECIFVFDNINRILNVYSQDNYVKQTSIHLTRSDFINTLNATENADNLYTAISVAGDDNVTISAINPLGANVIYNFDYYLDWMSIPLRNKVKKWTDAFNSAKDNYYNLNLSYYTDLSTADEIELEIQKYNTQITMYTRLRNNIVAESITDSNSPLVDRYNAVILENGGTKVTVASEISETLNEIDNLLTACENGKTNAENEAERLSKTISSLRDEINKISNELSIGSYFTSEEYAELSHYIFEGSYTDEYVVITDSMTYKEKFEWMKKLFDRAEDRLKKVSQPSQEFEIDTENFVFVKDFKPWSEQLETGCLINVEMDDGDIALLFLSAMTINYDDHTLSMTFGNRFNKYDTKSLFDDVLGDISKSANTLNYIKDILYPIKNGELNVMQEALQTSRDITMRQAMSSTDEEVVIDGSGYTGKKLLSDGSYDPHQVKLTSNTLVFTDDAWETCKVALGQIQVPDNNGNTYPVYGINAETIIGDIILGNELKILDNDGNELLSVVDGKINTSVSSAMVN